MQGIGSRPGDQPQIIQLVVRDGHWQQAAALPQHPELRLLEELRRAPSLAWLAVDSPPTGQQHPGQCRADDALPPASTVPPWRPH